MKTIFTGMFVSVKRVFWNTCWILNEEKGKHRGKERRCFILYEYFKHYLLCINLGTEVSHLRCQLCFVYTLSSSITPVTSWRPFWVRGESSPIPAVVSTVLCPWLVASSDQLTEDFWLVERDRFKTKRRDSVTWNRSGLDTEGVGRRSSCSWGKDNSGQTPAISVFHLSIILRQLFCQYTERFKRTTSSKYMHVKSSKAFVLTFTGEYLL